jgi:hypothetical protein
MRYNAIAVYQDYEINRKDRVALAKSTGATVLAKRDVGLWLFVPTARIVSHVDLPSLKIEGRWIYPMLSTGNSAAIVTGHGSEHFYIDTSSVETARELVVAANVRMLDSGPRSTTPGARRYVVFHDPVSESERLERAYARIGDASL